MLVPHVPDKLLSSRKIFRARVSSERRHARISGPIGGCLRDVCVMFSQCLQDVLSLFGGYLEDIYEM